jgi:hypothetical protein
VVRQVNILIATAKTPAEHERIARYYQAKALDNLAQAKEREAMVAAYKSNSTLSNNKNQVSTINHCEYFMTTFKALAENSQYLAALHERTAVALMPRCARCAVVCSGAWLRRLW